jgi:hypothetical protein
MSFENVTDAGSMPKSRASKRCWRWTEEDAAMATWALSAWGARARSGAAAAHARAKRMGLEVFAKADKALLPLLEGGCNGPN